MMSPGLFHVYEHTLPTSHIREYPRATANDQEEVLHLAIKQYVPRTSAPASSCGVTIIGAHANGFPKELYEPLWEDLYQRLEARGIHIRSIWIADVAHQGASGVLNEDRLGNDPSWNDHPRDLFLMINHFRQHMQRPLIGVGHSMGGNHLVQLSLLHPQLFTTLILVDPVIARFPSSSSNYNPAKASTKRRDQWPSRKFAAEKMLKSAFYKAWDDRVFERWVKYGFRDLPTALYPDATSPSSTPPQTPPTITPDASLISPTDGPDCPVTLSTTKHQEVFTFMRPNFSSPTVPRPTLSPNRETHPDINASQGPQAPFYRPESAAVFARLPSLRPSVFYVFGDPNLTDLSTPPLKADKLANTGTGVGGSGGVKEGRVSSVTIDGVGHLIPMEAVGRLADEAASWTVPELERWRIGEERFRREWDAVPKNDKSRFSEEYVRVMNSNWTETMKDAFLKESKL